MAVTAGGIRSVLAFTSETPIDSSGNTTVYMGLGGRVSTTESNVRTPISAATLTNLRCYPSGTVGGTSLVVTAGVGACTGALTYGASKPTVTPATSVTAVSDTSNTMTVSDAQCIALELAITGNINSVFINCTMDKTANS